MKIHERLFNMSKAQEAFRVKNGRWTVTVVPFGPYAGTWWYRTGMLVYKSYIFQYVQTQIKGKKVTLPLPAFLYDEPKKFFVEQQGNVQQALYRKLWSNFRFAHLDPLEREVDQYVVDHGFIKESASLCLALTPDVFRSVTYAFPERVKHVTEWLHLTQILQNIGVSKRKLFVERALQHGLKYALRKSFRKASSQAINSVLALRYYVDARLLVQASLPLPFRVFKQLGIIKRELFELPGIAKEEIIAEKVVLKYGYEALDAYYLYCTEYARAILRRIPVGRLCTTVQNREGYARLHDRIAVLIAEDVEADLSKNRDTWEQKHKENWKGLCVPSTITPLLTYADFKREGKEMHHCVSGYFQDTHWLFAHIDFKGEQATAQFNETGVDQIRGVCNEVVSSDLKAHFMSFYNSTK